MVQTRTRCLALLLCLFTLITCISAASALETEVLPDSDVQEEVLEEAAPDEATPTEKPEKEPASEEDYSIQTLASDLSFSTILTSSQLTSANNYLNYVSGSGKKAVSIHQVTIDGATSWAYCADSRKDWPGSYTNFSEADLPTSAFYQVQKIVMQLGFGDNNTTRLKQLFGYTLNNYEAYQATQIVMWAAQAWESQWTYIASAPSSIRDGVLNYWKASTPDGKDQDAYNFALALADAVQSVYEDGIGCDLAIAQDSTSVTSYRYKITVKPKNYLGGYSATLSGLLSGATLTSSDGDVTVSSASTFSSTASSGTDTLYLTIPRTASAQSLSVTLKVTPYVRKYSTNSAVGYLTPASSSYQTILYGGGTLSTAPVSKQATLSVPRLPTGKVTITKLDAETKKPVPGVVFALYQYDGTNYVNTGKTATSNSSGITEFTGLQYNSTNLGRYRIFEVSSDTHEVWTNRYVCWFSLASGLWYSYESATSAQATGYATQNSSRSYDFTFAFTAYNQEKVKNGSLTIRKRDGSGNPLAEVSFVVTDETGASVLFSKGGDGAYVPDTKGSARLTTDAKGQIQVKELPFGTYLVTEVETSEGGYTLLPTSFTVTLPYTDKDGNEQLELTYTVVNHSGFTLPATGGSACIIWPFIGLSLLAITLTIYAQNRKRSFFS